MKNKLFHNVAISVLALGTLMPTVKAEDSASTNSPDQKLKSHRPTFDIVDALYGNLWACGQVCIEVLPSRNAPAVALPQTKSDTYDSAAGTGAI